MRARIALLLAAMLVLGACGGPYVSILDYGPHPAPKLYVPPTFIGIREEQLPPSSNPPSGSCLIGLTAGGVGVVAATAFAPVTTTAWFVFSSVVGAGAGLDMGKQLGDCWDEYKANKPAFDVEFQCPVDGPRLWQSFDDYGDAVAFVNMKQCFCSVSCQIGFQDPAYPSSELFSHPGVLPEDYLFQSDKKVFHGAVRMNGPVQPPPDYNALAASMGLGYDGCVDFIANENRCGN